MLVPFVINGVNEKAANNQKEADSIRAQNASIREAQSKLVDEFSTIVFMYQTLAADVSWFRTKKFKNEALSKTAYYRYSERVVDLLARWRSLQTRAKSLTSPDISAKMYNFQLRVFKDQDSPMNTLFRTGATDEQWAAQHQINIRMLTEADNLIVEIMNDLGISKAQLR